jgi:hypothetical protein
MDEIGLIAAIQEELTVCRGLIRRIPSDVQRMEFAAFLDEMEICARQSSDIGAKVEGVDSTSAP